MVTAVCTDWNWRVWKRCRRTATAAFIVLCRTSGGFLSSWGVGRQVGMHDGPLQEAHCDNRAIHGRSSAGLAVCCACFPQHVARPLFDQALQVSKPIPHAPRAESDFGKPSRPFVARDSSCADSEDFSRLPRRQETWLHVRLAGTGFPTEPYDR